VQHLIWGGAGLDLLQAASRATPWWHLLALVGAGLLTGAGQLLLTRLSNANGIDITAAIWFYTGRLPTLRTLGSAVLSVVIVGMGAALGREGAPKQAGAVIATTMSDPVRLSDDQRRLLVACGAGAGMAAAYGVPLGGALFALEVLRGALALRFVLPALVTTLVATSVSWIFCPRRRPTRSLPIRVRSPAPDGRPSPDRSWAWFRCSMSGRWRGPIATIPKAGSGCGHRLRHSACWAGCRSHCCNCSVTATTRRNWRSPDRSARCCSCR
jgi:H+/Cl- antiporter ClcA